MFYFRKADFNVSTLGGWTPLMLSINQQNLESKLSFNHKQYLLHKVTKMILMNGNSDVNKITSKGTALHLACKCKNKEIIALILSKNPDIGFIF